MLRVYLSLIHISEPTTPLYSSAASDVYKRQASADSLDYKINQTLEVSWAGIKALRGTVVSELPVAMNAKTSRFQGINEFLLEESL